MILIYGCAGNPLKSKNFNRQAWLDDYSSLKTHLESSYANLIWFASPNGGVNLPDLDRRTLAALRDANDDAAAEAIIESFVNTLHDGHFSKLSSISSSGDIIKAPQVNRSANSELACSALGYVHRKGVAFSLPFEATKGFHLIKTGEEESFRTGIATLVDGRKVGIIRISQFTPYEFPNECKKAWREISKESESCDKSCIKEVKDFVIDHFISSLSERLHLLSKLKVSAVVVDLGGNPGGNDLGDWIPRLFTENPVHSPRLGVVRDPKAAKYFEAEITGFQRVLKDEKSEPAKLALSQALEDYERMDSLTSKPLPCKMDWVWKEQRDWNPLALTCTNLIFGKSYSSGAINYVPPGALGSKRATEHLYWPSEVDNFIGSWKYPVFVLIDNRTASAAEAAASVFQDNHVARLIGTPTSGDGCGFMYDGSEYTLPRSGTRYRIPNCLRLRADGSDEVKGVQPDIFLPTLEGESDVERAVKFLDKLNLAF